MAGPRPKAGTVTESLREIRELLHDLDERGGKGAPPPIESGPAADALRETGTEALSPHAIAAPGTLSGGMRATPASVSPPRAAQPHRRTAAAMLTVIGLVVLGAAGLVAADGLDTPPPAVSAAGKRQARIGDAPEAMARAALPPVPNVATPKGDVAPEPPAEIGHAEIGHKAPQNADAGTWRPPSDSQVRILLPAIAPDIQARSAGKEDGHRRAGRTAALPHGSAATAFAPAPAVPHRADLTPPGAPEQPQSARFSRRAAPQRTAQAIRSDEFPHEDRPAHRLSPTSAEGEDDLPQSLTEPALRGPVPWPTRANASPAPAWGARQSRAALSPPAGEVGGNGLERSAGGRADYPPAVAQRPRQLFDGNWSDRGFPPEPPMPSDQAATGAFPLSPPPRYQGDAGAGLPYPSHWRAQSLYPAPPAPPPPP